MPLLFANLTGDLDTDEEPTEELKPNFRKNMRRNKRCKVPNTGHGDTIHASDDGASSWDDTSESEGSADSDRGLPIDEVAKLGIDDQAHNGAMNERFAIPLAYVPATKSTLHLKHIYA
ncbi:hypothetical protein LTR84_010609 [Exophiala bonariae]|uniref:Uncharacterized protein n=1 Tax=Exophiala bonariae TaxID=1690606 RepID=A0AAV9MVG5_9EURO|nr:hypothetical protein LTR84_010609 [Exophiala bonariae]